MEEEGRPDNALMVGECGHSEGQIEERKAKESIDGDLAGYNLGGRQFEFNTQRAPD